jgi:hypothetical protein
MFCACALAVAGALPACSRPSNPWTYNTPPTASAGDIAQPDHGGRRVVVLGDLQSPRRSPLAQWDAIGPGISDALARTAFNEGTFEVRVDAALAKRVRRLADRPYDERLGAIEKIRLEHAELRFVVFGKVTDFAHTTDVPRDARRRGLIGHRREAVAAVQLHIFDLVLAREIASDHLVGVSPAGRIDSQKLYADIDFGSYVFWNTPLGKASEQVITEAVALIDRVVPAPEDTVRVVRQTGPRKIKLVARRGAALTEGHRYYVCVFPDPMDPTVAVPVRDADSDEPILAQIEKVKGERATALLIGKKSMDVDLRGAVLRTVLPPAPAPGVEIVEVPAGDEPDR